MLLRQVPVDSSKEAAMPGVNLLSDEPVADKLLAQLHSDLDEAQLIRFAVAYVSGAGLDVIGRDRLVRLLKHQRSFGIATMHAGCGYKPLLELQGALPRDLPPRLKYFMEPMVKSSGDDDPDLLHTKLLYLANPEAGWARIYIGSHNWSLHALGGVPGSVRNAEASLRLEEPFDPSDLEGSGTGLASRVNRHLRACFDLPPALEAIPANEEAFEEWMERHRASTGAEALDSVAVVLAACRNEKAAEARTPAFWSALQRSGLYLQILRETEGEIVWDRSKSLVLLVWTSEADMAQARAPVILHCFSSQLRAGPDSKLHGNSRGGEEIAGFAAAIYDPQQASDLGSKATELRPDAHVVVPRGTRVNHFWFEPQPKTVRAGDLDGAAVPLYQHYLQIREVVIPAWMERDNKEQLPTWQPDDLAFCDRTPPALEQSPGYHVEPERERQILACFEHEFGLPPERLGIRPYSEEKSPRVGLRVVDHPIHDAYLDAEAQKLAHEFYRRRRPGQLVPELWPKRRPQKQTVVERVFKTKTSRLSRFVERLAR
jgi:hypothetical protein